MFLAWPFGKPSRDGGGLGATPPLLCPASASSRGTLPAAKLLLLLWAYELAEQAAYYLEMLSRFMLILPGSGRQQVGFLLGAYALYISVLTSIDHETVS